jgi:hypothetical protein
MPTFRHGKNVNVFIDEFDFSTYFNDVSASTTVDTAETSAFGTSAKTYVVGHRDGTVSLSGMFEGTASTGTDEFFDNALGNATKALVIVAPEGHSNGAGAIMLEADDTSYEVSSAIADIVQASAEFQSTDAVEHGKILSSGSTVTATGNGTAVDNGASTTNGGAGFLSVPVNTRNGNITVKIQHSADNSTFADLVTFTVVSGTTTTSEKIEVADGTTVNRYLRVNYTVAGSTGSATPVVAFTRR